MIPYIEQAGLAFYAVKTCTALRACVDGLSGRHLMEVKNKF